MKTTSMAVVCLVLTLVGVRAQVASVPVSTGQSTGTATIQPANYQVVASGPNQNVWQSETYATNADGEVVTNLHQYTELATGLNYQDANGNWMPAQEVIESFAQGAIARQGQHQIIFANNLNTAGSIDLQTPDGKRLLSNILGLGYYDTSSGQSVLIGQIQDSQGELISANQVLYTNAFNGVKADVRYTYRRGSFEQDVILREQPPAPATLGMNPATTELEVLTEFLNPPGATVMPRPGQAGEDEDDDVDWGTMRIIRGKAFDLDAGSNDAYPLTAVTKQYGVVQGRNILIEKVRLPDIQATLSTLPLQSSGRSSLPSDLAKNFTLPRTPLAATQTRPIKMATSTPAGKGYVLDYITINTTSSNQTFRADTTYFVNGSDYLTGTAVFEGGTVIKFSDNSALNPQLNINGNWVCQTSPYHPAIFTTMDDNSVGDIISGSTGSPGIVSGTHYFTVVTSTNTSISNFRFSYPKYGLSPQSSGPFDVWDCQFVQCQYAISVGVNTDIRLHNVLFTAAGYAAVSFLTGVGSLIGENVTANVTDLVDTTAKKAVAIDLTNSIVFYTGSSLWATNVYTNCTVFNPSRAYVQNVGAGAYYQTNGSPYLHAGTTNITPALLADLATKTVWPPVVYANTNITNNLTLTIQALRDTNASPDMGYHHDPLDYILDGANFYSTLTLTNGVAVGCYDQPGIEIRGSNSIVSIGTPLAPNWLVRYPAAQEQPWFPDGSSYAAGQNITEVPSGTARPSGLFQFTHFSTPAGGGPDFYDRGSTSFTALTIQHSEFWGGTNDFSGLTNATSTLLVQNNLFFRSSIYASNSAATSLALTNNTIYGTTLALVQPASAAWYFYDNDVDSSTLSTNSAITNGYNAFINCSNNFIGTSNIVSTNAIGYQSAKLGNFYQPISSPLLQAGSTTADQVGLYAFTTQTNQLEETNSIVDIGYHYVALGTNGLPLDVNGDGIPDYLQNFNSAPVITVQPTNQVVQQGSNAVFNVTATGTAPLSYQWWFNATNKLAASTNTTLTVTNVQSTNTGNYTVVVTNVAGSVTSSVASLTLLAAPVITSQPTNVTVVVGSNAVFSVTATGSSPLHYQWRFNTTNLLAGATNASVTLTNVQTTNAGNYSVVITNLAGSVTSSNALRTVLVRPSITVQPTNVVVQQGSNAVFSVTATGTAPLSYQWWFNATNKLAASTNTSLTVTNVQSTNTGNYTVVVTNVAGSVTSSVASLTLLAAPTISIQPTNVTALQGSNAVFSVTVTGSSPFNFQWQFNGSNVPNNIITTVAGNGTAGYSGDGGPATNANLYYPHGASIDAYGNLYIADYINNCVRKVGANGIINTIAGNGTAGYSGDGGAATNATMDRPAAVAVDSVGNLLIADQLNNRIRKVSTNGIITTVAGNGSAGYSGDGGAATNASMHSPVGVAVDAAGNIFIADYSNYRIRKVGTNGIIRTVAGDGSAGRATVGITATNSSLYPNSIAVDNIGNFYIAGYNDPRIFEVGTNGIINSVAGVLLGGYSGDGGAATNANLWYPADAVIDPFGNLYIADYYNNRVRKVDTNGIITTVAGNGTAGYSGDGGAATNASLNYPDGVAVDAAGNLFIADTSNNSIRRIGLAGQSTLIVTNVTTNNAGIYSVIVTDLYGTAISSNATLTVLVPPFITTQPSNQTLLQGNNAVLTVVAAGTTPLSYQWWYNATNMLVAATNATFTITNAQLTNTGNYFVVVTNAAGSVVSSNALLTVQVPPTVTLTNPANNVFILSGYPIRLGASAADVDGTVTQVQFFQGTNLLGVSTVSPYDYIWTSPAPGVYALSAVATDNNNLSTTSSVVNVTTYDLPSVSLTNPASQSLFICTQTNVILGASASETGGTITQVQFFQRTNYLGSVSNAPYTLTWSNVVDGSYALTAVATDNSGRTNISSVVNITVARISLAITNPLNNTIFTSCPTNISLATTASDLVGSITNVQYFSGTTNLGGASVSPYSLTWSNVPTGNYGLTAVATDNNGYSTTSSVVNIYVTPLFNTNNMNVWLKADAIGGLSNGMTISNWVDSSGWGNNATQTSTNAQPIYLTNILNGHPVVQFNGGQALNVPSYLSSLPGAEAFVVLNSTTPLGTSAGLWYVGYSAYDDLYPYTDGSIQETFGASTAYNLGVPAQPLSQYHVFNVMAQSNNWAAWINGQLLYQTTANTVSLPASIELGDNWSGGFNGGIAEILIFNRGLSNSERAMVNSYLNSKYGLVAAVPATPTNLTAVAISATQVALTWDEASSGDTQIAIERSTTSNGVYQVVSQIANTSSFVDTNLLAGTTYYYQVQALNLIQWTPPSNLAQATTPSNGVAVPFGALVVWLKADAGLIQGNTNTLVSYWPDQSGNGNDASQTAASAQPVWVPGAVGDRPAVQFNGGQELNIPSNLSSLPGAEAFVVLKSTTPLGTSAGLWYVGYNASYDIYPQTDGSIQETFGTSSPYNLGVPVQPLSQYHLFNVMAQSNNWAAWIDGQQLYQTTANTLSLPNGIQFGGNYSGGFNGDIAEILIFNRGLSLDEKQAVETYLFSKYGLLSFSINTLSPATPTNLVATGVAANQLNLQWARTSANETGFSIERKQGTNGIYQEIGTVLTGVTNYSDYGVSQTNQYFYHVKAENYFGNSGYSAEVSPPVVTVTLLSTNSYVLVGSTNIFNVQALDADYVVNQVSIVKDTYMVIATNAAVPSTNNWVAPFLQSTYYFQANASDTAGNSWFSPAIAVSVCLDSTGDGIPDVLQVQSGNNPINPWTPPAFNTNDTTAPLINLAIPTNAIIVP